MSWIRNTAKKIIKNVEKSEAEEKATVRSQMLLIPLRRLHSWMVGCESYPLLNQKAGNK
jgi:hypothetical protein